MILNIVWFLAGFLVCAHWDGAREFVQDHSPAYTSPIKAKYEDIKEQVKDKIIKTLEDSSDSAAKKVEKAVTK